MNDIGVFLKRDGYTICNYGVSLESTKFGLLSPSGKLTQPELPMTIMLDDDDYISISEAYPHEDLGEYYLAIRVTDMAAAGAYEGDGDSKFVADIMVVSPASCPKSIERADGNADDGPVGQAVNLIMYGQAAVVWQAASDNPDLLVAEATKRLAKVNGMLGFYLDTQQNQAGNTGWDWVRDS